MKSYTFSGLILVGVIFCFLWLWFPSVGAGQGEPVGLPLSSEGAGKPVEPKTMAKTPTSPESSLFTVFDTVGFLGAVLVVALGVFLGVGLFYLAELIYNTLRGPGEPEPPGPGKEDPRKLSPIFPETVKIEATVRRETEEDFTFKTRLEALEKAIKKIEEEQKAVAKDLSVPKFNNLGAGLSGPPSLTNHTPIELEKAALDPVSDEEEIWLVEQREDSSGHKVCCIQVRDKIKGSPRKSGNIITTKGRGDCLWEVRGIKSTNFDLNLNQLFLLTRQGGVIKNTSKPAIVEGNKEAQTIHVKRVSKGMLEMEGAA